MKCSRTLNSRTKTRMVGFCISGQAWRKIGSVGLLTTGRAWKSSSEKTRMMENEACRIKGVFGDV